MFSRLIMFLSANNQAAGTAASIVQALAVVVAGVWFGWVFYYSEVIKPKQAETYLSPQFMLVLVGTEKDEKNEPYYIFRLDMGMGNNSGQKLFVASSIFVVSADKLKSESDEFTAAMVQGSLNSRRGANARYRGGIEKSEVIYVGSEFARMDLSVSEKVSGSRLFRVPVGKFDQLEANWYVISGTDLDEVKISHVAIPDKTYDFQVESCACTEDCPKISPFDPASSSACKAPWFDLGSKEGMKLFGDPNKMGKFTATSFFLMPPKIEIEKLAAQQQSPLPTR